MARARERIVVGTDFSAAGDAALRRVATLYPRGTPLRIDVVYVIAPLALPPGVTPGEVGYAQMHERDAAATLAVAVAGLRRQLGPQAQIAQHVLHGSPWEMICTLATRVGANMIVVGRHAREGIQQALIGSVTDRVVRLAPCAVLVVPHPRRMSSRRRA